MGGSYGGYATLVGAAFTPEKFAAAIDYVAMSDLTTFLDGMPPLIRPIFVNSWHRYLGDPADPEQRADMLARSPVSRVGDIRCPLLIAQGGGDVRIVQSESDTIAAALRDRGVEVEYLVF